MKAAVMMGIQSIAVQDRPVPVIKPDQVIVNIKAAGICGSDYHGFVGPDQQRRQPGLIVGHEAAGVVYEVGVNVRGWKKGDRVVIDPQATCGECVQCRHGWPNLCDNMSVIGSSMRNFHDGAMCEYISLPPGQLIRLPNNLSYEEGAMLDPVGNALHLFNRVKITINDTVVIVGAGTIGLVAIQTARISGAGKVVAVDINEKKLSLAKELGADQVINSSKTDWIEHVMKETDGNGADIVVEAVGRSETYAACINAVKKRGSVIALGFMEPAISIPIQPLLFREISIIGSTGFVFECEAAMKLMGDGLINVKPIITHSFPIEEVQHAFEATRDRDAVKIMLKI